jgi:hypothetical protein
MAIPTPKVEIGFDLTDSPIGPFFRLDDPVAGVLGNPDYRLGGTIFYDVTDRVRTIDWSRGKSRRFSNFQAGSLGVEFNNHDRAFDPLYVDSPFYGNIIPRREIRVSSGTAIQFTGWIDDWGLTYTPDGNSLADAAASDAFTIIANQTIAAGTPTQELTSERINTILSAPGVAWSNTLRDIEAGQVEVGTQEITANTNALNYMQKVTVTEGGLFFVSKSGALTFRDSVDSPNSATLVTFDQGDNIPYKSIGIVYGAELLYNEVTIANEGGGTAVAESISSQGEYGIRALAITDLLGATDEQSVDLAVKYVDLYSQPEYRVEQLEVCLHDLDQTDQDTVLGLELGSICKVAFTPNGIGDPIEKFIQVISIKNSVKPTTHYITFGFQEIKYLSLVLDDAVFGKLDAGTLG